MPPPPYSSTTRTSTRDTSMQLPDEHDGTTTIDELKEAFAALTGHETETMHLLRSVADSLAACPDLGTSHPLAVKWDGIRQVCPWNSTTSPAIVIDHCVGMPSADAPLQTRYGQVRHAGIP